MPAPPTLSRHLPCLHTNENTTAQPANHSHQHMKLHTHVCTHTATTNLTKRRAHRLKAMYRTDDSTTSQLLVHQPMNRPMTITSCYKHDHNPKAFPTTPPHSYESQHLSSPYTCLFYLPTPACSTSLHLLVLPPYTCLFYLPTPACSTSLHLLVLPPYTCLFYLPTPACSTSLHLLVLPPYTCLFYLPTPACSTSLHLLVLPPYTCLFYLPTLLVLPPYTACSTSLHCLFYLPTPACSTSLHLLVLPPYTCFFYLPTPASSTSHLITTLHASLPPPPSLHSSPTLMYFFVRSDSFSVLACRPVLGRYTRKYLLDGSEILTSIATCFSLRTWTHSR